MPRNKAYCAIMDDANIYITISTDRSYIKDAPNLFGGTIERNDKNDRLTLQREVYEESQTQIRIDVSKQNFESDLAFIHPAKKVDDRANPNAFYYQKINDADYNCYLIDMTKGVSHTTVAIVPGNAGYPVFTDAQLWHKGKGQPNSQGDYIMLKTKKQLIELGRKKSNEERGVLWGVRSLSFHDYEKKLMAYTDAAYIISIPRNRIRKTDAGVILGQCSRIMGRKFIDRNGLGDFYPNVFDKLCQFV